MGAGCTSGLTVFSNGEKTVKVLIVGRPRSGKSYLLYSWKYGVECILSVEPTSHFNVDTITSPSGRRILVFDLAGNIGLRLRPFLEGTNGVVYMLYRSSSCGDFLPGQELNTIQLLLQERDLLGVPFLFVLRQDTGGKRGNSLPDLLVQSLRDRLWHFMEMQSNSQEETSAVLKALEDLLNNHLSTR